MRCPLQQMRGPLGSDQDFLDAGHFLDASGVSADVSGSCAMGLGRAQGIPAAPDRSAALPAGGRVSASSKCPRGVGGAHVLASVGVGSSAIPAPCVDVAWPGIVNS